MKKTVVSIWDRRPLAILGAVLKEIPSYVDLRHEHTAVHPTTSSTYPDQSCHFTAQTYCHTFGFDMKWFVPTNGPAFIQKETSRLEILASSDVPLHEAWAVDCEAYHALVVELFLRSFQFEQVESFDVSKPGELLATMLRFKDYPELCVQIIWRRDQIFKGVF